MEGNCLKYFCCTCLVVILPVADAFCIVTLIFGILRRMSYNQPLTVPMKGLR